MDDDYVAQILAKEAKESSIKYASQGMSAFMPLRPTSNAPKPNTRFLRNLIKVTDSHNTALKLKEEREARERMRQLKNQASGASSALAQTSIDRSSKRSDYRSEVRGSRDNRRGEREDRIRSYRKRTRSRSPSAEQDRSRRRRQRNEDYGGTGERGKDRDEHRREQRDHESSRRDRRDTNKEHTRRRRERSYSRSPSRSPHKDRSTDRHHHRRQKHQSRPYTRSLSRSRSPDSYKSRRSKREDVSPYVSRSSRIETTRHKRGSPLSTITALQTETDVGNESDPLEDLVGPLPPRQNEAPIRSRGRGAYKHNVSNIDAHFAPGYDPATDVHLDEDKLHSVGQESSRRPVAGLMTKEDDWDMAMEALRDRERWRNKGEERLRTAGIDEATIDKWKKNTAFAGVDGKGKPEDVQWSKKGEGREWDRGKFVDDDGHIDVRAAW
ncbi:LUC7 related [Penicillium digitatum]|uniref:LUC7 related n=1 Tax=Penicillium digitatum TaxID=36651 RepID=A0A7T6XVT4_PENDI|nr:LUC7 related [Penicillium digitatum]